MNALATATDAAAPVTDTPAEQLVAHLATMLRTSRDFAWVMGPATRTWRLMVAAFAAQDGLSIEQAEKLLAACRGKPARVVALEEEVRELKRENLHLKNQLSRARRGCP